MVISIVQAGVDQFDVINWKHFSYIVHEELPSLIKMCMWCMHTSCTVCMWQNIIIMTHLTPLESIHCTLALGMLGRLMHTYPLTSHICYVCAHVLIGYPEEPQDICTCGQSRHSVNWQCTVKCALCRLTKETARWPKTRKASISHFIFCLQTVIHRLYRDERLHVPQNSTHVSLWTYTQCDSICLHCSLSMQSQRVSYLCRTPFWERAFLNSMNVPFNPWKKNVDTLSGPKVSALKRGVLCIVHVCGRTCESIGQPVPPVMVPIVGASGSYDHISHAIVCFTLLRNALRILLWHNYQRPCTQAAVVV